MGDFIFQYHVAPRTKLCSKGRFSDTSKQASIDDDWHMEGDKSKSEPRIGKTRLALLNNNRPQEICGYQGRLTTKQVTTRPGNIWSEEWSNVAKGSQRKTKNEWLERKPKLEAAREQRGICFIPDDDLDYPEIIFNATRKLEIRRATAMLCKVTTAANPNESSWRRPCASEWVEDGFFMCKERS